MTLAKPIAVIAFLFAALIWFVSPAHAQSTCGRYDDYVKALFDKYQETSIGKGLSGSGLVVIELFTSEETYTVLATITATGKTCIIAAGKGWVAAIPVIPGVPL